MAYEIPGFSFTLPAGADFSNTAQFRFAAVSNTGTAVAPAAGGSVVGVRYTKSKSGEATTIVGTGIAIVESGDNTIVAGTKVTTTNVGTAKTANANELIAGIALEASTATGIQIAVLLTNGQAKA